MEAGVWEDGTPVTSLSRRRRLRLRPRPSPRACNSPLSRAVQFRARYLDLPRAHMLFYMCDPRVLYGIRLFYNFVELSVASCATLWLNVMTSIEVRKHEPRRSHPRHVHPAGAVHRDRSIRIISTVRTLSNARMTKDEAIELLIIAEEQGDAEALYMLGDECLAKAFSHGVDGDEEWIAIAHDARRAAELAL